MRTSPDARQYAKAAPNATPEEAFHAGVLHERTRQRSLQKAATRAHEESMLTTVAKALIKSEATS